MIASLTAGDFSRAIDTIAANWNSHASALGGLVRSWIKQIPERLWSDDARIIAALGASYLSMDSPDSTAALPHFELAELQIAAGVSSRADLPAIRVQHAVALRGAGRLTKARAKAESAWALLQEELPLTLPLRLTLQAEAALQLGLISLHSGDIRQAATQLRLGTGLSENGVAVADIAEGLGAMALAAYADGDFDTAELHISRARELATTSPLLSSRFGAPALIAETLIAADRNDAANALTSATAAAGAARNSDWEPLAFYARAVSAAINGQLIEALDLQRRCTSSVRDWEGDPAVRALAEALRAGIHLQLGESGRAVQLVTAIEPLQDHASCPGSQLAGIRFSTADYVGCLEALDECLALGDQHSGRTLVDVLLLQAAAHYELDNQVTADVAFDQALYLGTQTGIRVPFLVIPRITMLRMLNRAADRYQPDRVHRLLDELRVGNVTTDQLTEPLSTRELEIAHHLFQDKTAGQIASELFISVNTVKTHVRSIYRKLSATNRREAINRVHELGLDVRITPF